MGRIVPDLIEQYLADLAIPEDQALARVREDSRARSLPSVDPPVGGLLHVLALTAGARHVLEIGTANGYSGLWLGRALPPDGRLITIEIDPDRAALARTHFEAAGLGDRVHVMVGDAARLVHKVAGPFDLIFQDGDKLLYEPLLDRLVGLLRPGALLITDNVLWDGEVVPGFVANPARSSETTSAIASANRRLAEHPDLVTSIVPLRDGVAVSVKR